MVRGVDSNSSEALHSKVKPVVPVVRSEPVRRKRAGEEVVQEPVDSVIIRGQVPTDEGPNSVDIVTLSDGVSNASSDKGEL